MCVCTFYSTEYPRECLLVHVCMYSIGWHVGVCSDSDSDSDGPMNVPGGARGLLVE